MVTGADKVISYGPPGAIGLVDTRAILLMRFDETESSARPQDAKRVMGDFDVGTFGLFTVTAMPAVVPAALGRGRMFDGAATGLLAQDLDSGATLLTRDMSIQVVLSWDAALQLSAGQPGVIVVRGLGGSPAQYVSYGLELDVINAPSFRGRLRWFWSDVGGVDHVATGADIVIRPNQFTLLTATRRWLSPTQVELSYYVGDELAGVETSANGSIGGGTTGTMQLGFRGQGSPGFYYAGILDELMIVDRVLCAEEVEATWLRMTLYQPRGAQLFSEMFDPDFPISDEPASDAQLDIRMTGQALGFAAAQTENLRANFLPGRAFGSTLTQWEEVVAVTPKPVQGIADRRARVEARLRQRQGISIPGLKDALVALVDCDVEDLGFIAYSNTVVDSFDAVVDPLRWDMTPTGCVVWNAGRARFAPGAGTYLMTDSLHDWKTMARSVSQPSLHEAFGAEHVLTKLVLTTPQNNFEAGVWFGDKGLGNYLLLGLRQDGVFRVVTESFIGGLSQGVVVQATPGTNPAAIWLHLFEHAASAWTAAWSTTGPTSGYTSSGPITHPTLVHWAGYYIRSIAAVGAAPVADFDDFQLYTPLGSRPFNAYVLRDPGLGGSPDIEGARSVIRAIKHAFTHATLTESLTFITGPGGSDLGFDPL